MDVRVRASTSRAVETDEERDRRRNDDRVRASTSRTAETNDQHNQRLTDQKVRQARVRILRWTGTAILIMNPIQFCL